MTPHEVPVKAHTRTITKQTPQGRFNIEIPVKAHDRSIETNQNINAAAQQLQKIIHNLSQPPAAQTTPILPILPKPILEKKIEPSHMDQKTFEKIVSYMRIINRLAEDLLDVNNFQEDVVESQEYADKVAADIIGEWSIKELPLPLDPKNPNDVEDFEQLTFHPTIWDEGSFDKWEADFLAHKLKRSELVAHVFPGMSQQKIADLAEQIEIHQGEFWLAQEKIEKLLNEKIKQLVDRSLSTDQWHIHKAKMQEDIKSILEHIKSSNIDAGIMQHDLESFIENLNKLEETITRFPPHIQEEIKRKANQKLKNG